jgi:hypothetical protein
MQQVFESKNNHSVLTTHDSRLTTHDSRLTTHALFQKILQGTQIFDCFRVSNCKQIIKYFEFRPNRLGSHTALRDR